MLGPIQSIKTCLAKSFQFSGRASRSEFWWFALTCAAAVGALYYFDARIWGWDLKDGTKANILSSCFQILICIPLTSAAIRRVQDVGFHGAFVFIPALAMYAADLARSIMIDWFVINGIRIGHPESETGIRSLSSIGEALVAASFITLFTILLWPSRFAKQRLNRPSSDGVVTP